MYDQERFKPRNIAFGPKLHKNLLPVELQGFRVHMKVRQDQDAPRLPKHIKEGLKKKPEDATDLDLILTQSMEKKVMWFQMHHHCIHPVHHFPTEKDGTQINVVGGRFSKREAGLFDCAVVDHYIERKTLWLKYRICIGNVAERTSFKWGKIAFILDTVVASSTCSTTGCIAVTTCGGSWVSISVISLSTLIWMWRKTLR